ncbi:MFS transporter [Arcanobacterium bovis]|uniref:MFS transporter n=1 Tax=Arcanobacterium bovis TaxID=2529275 RepID=A0A4V2KR74_9ACTO|nr:MFS transporter [Arcanobacterium bovis]TBW22819.1 MFS transporter [Arcanobacterium bovis]
MKRKIDLGSKLGGYRDLPRLTSALYLLISFIGRLPTSMNVIGVLTLVTVTTGSVASGAVVSAAQAIATGIGNPIIGRLTDKYGQRRPLLYIAPVSVISLLSFVTAAVYGAPLWVLALLCALIGLTTSPIGALARIRWYELSKTPPQLAAALSWESTIDEMSFVLGPAAVGLLAALIHPAIPLIVTACIVVTCVVPFALSKYSVGASSTDEIANSPKMVFVMRRVAVSLGAMATLGMFFGAMQTSVTGYANAVGQPGKAGIIYAALGLSSAITALGAVVIPERISQEKRIIIAGIAIALGAFSCSLATSDWNLAMLMFVNGLAIGPASVAIFTLAGRLAPPGGGAVAVTALGSMNVIGVSLSSTLAGTLLEIYLPYGFYVAAGSALLMTFVTLLTARAEIRS